MDKPRQERGWRALLTELGIIVLGVSIALGAQQAADWLHWRSEVTDARAAITQEITTNNIFFARRIAITSCLGRQISQAEAILAALEAGREPGKFTTFRLGSGTLLSDSEWQSERASQVLTHFPRAEHAAMGRYYATLTEIHLWITMEGEAWQELSILQNPPRGITTSDLIRLRVHLGRAKNLERLIVLNGRRSLRLSKQIGIADVQANHVLVKAFCGKSDPDYLRYLRSQDFR